MGNTQDEMAQVIAEKFLELKKWIDEAEVDALKLTEKGIKSAAGKSRKSLEAIKKGAFELKKHLQAFKEEISKK